MTRLLQVWLGFRLYVICNSFYNMISKAVAQRSFWKLSFSTGLYIAYAVDIIGMAILFEKHKKIGFYLMLLSSALTFTVVLCMGVPLVTALWRATGLVPMAITYLLMAKRWNEFS